MLNKNVEHNKCGQLYHCHAKDSDVAFKELLDYKKVPYVHQWIVKRISKPWEVVMPFLYNKTNCLHIFN